tara:strand:- start:171 stop:1244 length:1074 start_codon:yes stop_codon:yes gene_type:complete
MTENMKVVWISVDPVRRKIDFYPSPIAKRIETAYSERDAWAPSACVLGSDFFNATVHFHPSGTCYQSTPGMSMGRAGFKQPGYRSVKRVFVNELDSISLYTKQVHGEWRIAKSETDYGNDMSSFSTVQLSEVIPDNTRVECGSNNNIEEQLKVWTSEDLNSGAFDVNVVVWQWCRGTPENQGNLLHLGDEWWAPYNSEITSIIEQAFKNQEQNVNIELPVIGERTIKFQDDTCYASQYTLDRTKSRFVRRVVKTIQEVKIMFDNLSKPLLNIDELIAGLPDGTYPHEFNCPILQDIMKDPVTTIDGFTYERMAIEPWFQTSSKSPLTGLSLTSKALIPNTNLKQAIDKFIAELTKDK